MMEVHQQTEVERLRERLQQAEESRVDSPVPENRKPLPGPHPRPVSVRLKTLGTLPLPGGMPRGIGSSRVLIPDPLVRGYRAHRDTSLDALRARLKAALGR